MTDPSGRSASLPRSSGSQAGQIGLVAAVSIGIGGMVGAGIFSILGVVAQAAGNMMWLALMIGVVVALTAELSGLYLLFVPVMGAALLLAVAVHVAALRTSPLEI